MRNIVIPVIEILVGIACVIFHKRFAYWANNHHRKLLLKKYNDEPVLRVGYIVAGTFLIGMGLWQLLK